MARGAAFGKFRPRQQYKVLCYNVEDDANEQKLRVSAACRAASITPDDVMGSHVQLIGPTDVGTLLTTTNEGKSFESTAAMVELEAYIAACRPDVVFLDPLIALHNADENDNPALRRVMAWLRALAVRYAMGVVIAHHTKKGGSVAGDPDSSRGATDIVNAARLVMTLCAMTEKEATEFKISADDRGDYFRVDAGKSNYSRKEGADWFKRIEYTLENGEYVAAAIPWTPVFAEHAQTVTATEQLIFHIERGTGMEPYAAKLSGDQRSIKRAMEMLNVPAKDHAKMLNQLLASGTVKNCEYKGGANRSIRYGLRTSDGPSANWTGPFQEDTAKND